MLPDGRGISRRNAFGKDNRLCRCFQLEWRRGCSHEEENFWDARETRFAADHSAKDSAVPEAIRMRRRYAFVFTMAEGLGEGVEILGEKHFSLSTTTWGTSYTNGFNEASVGETTEHRGNWRETWRVSGFGERMKIGSKPG